MKTYIDQASGVKVFEGNCNWKMSGYKEIKTTKTWQGLTMVFFQHENGRCAVSVYGALITDKQFSNINDMRKWYKANKKFFEV